MDYHKLLALAGELGYQMLSCGTEIYRVEDSINYLLKAYGIKDPEVFALPTCVFVGLSTPDHTPLSCMRRLPCAQGINLLKFEALNDACRRLCRDTPDLDVAWADVSAAADPKSQYSNLQICGFYAMCAGFFCLFFGSTWLDALMGGLCGFFVGVSQLCMDRLGVTLFFKTVASSFLLGSVAMFFTYIGLTHNSDLVITGALMPLVPGLAITNFMRDIIAGDMISGLSKLSDALLTATGLAVGSGFALTLVRALGGVI